LKTAGTESLTATDLVNASITGSQTAITVTAAAASTLRVSGFPSPTAVNSSRTFTITALDPYGNVATSFGDTIFITSSDSQATWTYYPTLTNGTETASASFRTLGTQSLTATDQANFAITGSQTGITVVAGPAAALIVSGFPSAITAGVAGTFTVTAVDAYGNVATSYTGPVHFFGGDWRTILPADSTLTNGTGTFSATFKTVGTQYLGVGDAVSGNPWGEEAGIVVNPGPATGIVGSPPQTVTAGTATSFSITAMDAYGNTATSFRGEVYFNDSDPQGTWVQPYIFNAVDAGVHTFAVTLRTAGSQWIQAMDWADNVGTTNSDFTVTPAAAAQFLITAPANAQAGVAFNLTLTVEDAYGNAVTGYTGTVHFSSSDQQAGLPADYTFGSPDAGVHTFSVILRTPGTQTITITDTLNSSLTGSAQVSL
jgi:hypothetical protein